MRVRVRSGQAMFQKRFMKRCGGGIGRHTGSTSSPVARTAGLTYQHLYLNVFQVLTHMQLWLKASNFHRRLLLRDGTLVY